MKKTVIIETLICLGVLAILCLIPVYMIWTDNNLDYVVSLIKGKPVNVPFWISALFSIVANGIGLLFNLIVEIIKIAK